jgi:hypothetical protein
MAYRRTGAPRSAFVRREPSGVDDDAGDPFSSSEYSIPTYNVLTSSHEISMPKSQPNPADLDFPTLLAQSMAELRLKTEGHDGTWHLGEADWSVDQDMGQIVFTARGITATCPVQIIGTYNTTDGTWLWGWDHPSVEPALQEDARRVRKYGERNRIAKLTTQKLCCSEDNAWEFTAMACKLGNRQGGYRGPAGETLVFMTFGDVTLSKS